MLLPYISICIPSYNRPKGLERLLQSIAEQTYSNYEIVITDDTLTPIVENLVMQWKGRLPITYVKNETSLGSPKNWNKAVALAKYDWVKIMHDDDWFATIDSLEQFANATLQECSFIFSGNTNIYFEEKREVIEILSKEHNTILKKDSYFLFYKNVIGHPSNTMYKKNALKFDKRFKWVVDVDFYINYLLNSSYYYIDASLINTGIDSSTVSNTSYKNPMVEIPEYLYMLDKFGKEKLLTNEYIFAAIWTLIKKFKIKNTNTIKQSKYINTIAEGVAEIIAYQNSIPHVLLKQTPINNYFMKKGFAKLKNANVV